MIGRGLAVATLAMAVGAGSASAAVTLAPIGSYSEPTYITSDPRDPERVLVVERSGTIDVTSGAGTALYLDLTDLVRDAGPEQGLWSMAFAPDFAQTGRFYVAYSADNNDLTLDEYTERATPAATRATRRPVMAIPNTAGASNHNGGQLQFGPDDYLYWSTGEDANAPNAQMLDNPLGKILRIDPRGATPGAYTVPTDNPFVGDPGAETEIWAYGLRNPWRFSFDRLTGALAIGDVGAGSREEVDYLTREAGGGAGVNFGWPCREGLQAGGGTCLPVPLTNPIYDYDSNAGRCAITGGYVVRDEGLGDLYGRYLFADLCEGALASIDPLSPPAPDGDRLEGPSVGSPTSFGEDACGRVYLAAFEGDETDNNVFRLVGDSGGVCPAAPPDTTPPETNLKKRKTRRRARRVFQFSANELGATFQCRLDMRAWQACESPRRLTGLDRGHHRFRVRATDAAQNTDPTPAKKRFKVKPPRRG
jgi:glucose/arabinose dehydrogenase